MARRLAPLSMCLGLLTLLSVARSAAAQTYVWTDERGVVHAAAEPSEVPAKFRAKAVQDAQRPRSNVTVLPPPETPAAPDAEADPTAPAPMRPGHKPQFAPPPKPAEPGPEAAPTPVADDDEPKKKGLGEPAPGFEWHCTPDPDGGKPKCEQFEKRSSKRARHAAARAEARKQLGVDPETENDPDVQGELQRRADQEYEKSTRKPAAPKPSGSDDAEDEPEESED